MKEWAAVLVLLMAGGNRAAAEDWPQWRGPQGTGVSGEKGVPARWSKDDVAWRTPLHGLGVSSPVVWGDRIFVTSQSGRGTRRAGDHPTLARGEEAAGEKPLGAGAAAGDPSNVETVSTTASPRLGVDVKRRGWRVGGGGFAVGGRAGTAEAT